MSSAVVVARSTHWVETADLRSLRSAHSFVLDPKTVDQFRRDVLGALELYTHSQPKTGTSGLGELVGTPNRNHCLPGTLLPCHFRRSISAWGKEVE